MEGQHNSVRPYSISLIAMGEDEEREENKEVQQGKNKS